MPKRAHILLPEDLLREIDTLVGPRGRSAFLVETARNEVRRHRLLQFLQSKDLAWKDEDHPELAARSGTWVRKVRAESESARELKNEREKDRGDPRQNGPRKSKRTRE
jgi:hypothetical protein